MAATTNYGWTLPEVAGSNGAWGGILNDFIIAADAALAGVESLAAAALSKDGGVMTGRLDLKTVSMSRIDAGSLSGAQAFDISVAQYFAFTLGAALQPSFTNVPAGTVAQGVIWRVTNGGAYVITWPASFKWVGGVAPTLTVAGIDLIGFITDDNGTTWRGIVLGKDIR